MSSKDEELPNAGEEIPTRVSVGTHQLGPSSADRFVSSSHNFNNQTVTLIRDVANWLSVIRSLQSTDVIVLLTPLVVPVSKDPDDISDPFECFGRALESRHSRIRHQPYTNRNGITSTHVGFIKRAAVIIFVMNEATILGDMPHVEAAHVTRVLASETPVIVVLTCNSQDLLRLSEDFPTVIQSRDYSRPSLEKTASLIFGEDIEVSLPGPRTTAPPSLGPTTWTVEQWDESQDIAGVADLWSQTVDARFAMHPNSLASLLRRPGYARHYVVKDASQQLLLGFCATFLSYVDQAGEKLIASVALLLVRSEYRKQGIGITLHNHAIEQLIRTRGVGRLQLGSTFPRILYGPPIGMDFDQTWFSRRGWETNILLPGQGRPVYDLLLDFNTWLRLSLPTVSDTLHFRVCRQEDMTRVLEIVETESGREEHMGWFDQYSRLINDDVNIKHVIVAVQHQLVIAVALTYTPSGGSPVSLDLPWARQIGNDVGGVTCICISSSITARRDALVLLLLNACVEVLRSQGMRRMFLDGIANNVEAFKQHGFYEWARYRDVWRDV